MKYIPCKPKIINNKIVHPKKLEYFDTIAQAAKETTEHYFGLYFSGSTFRQTGDWAVMSDDNSFVDSISLDEIYTILKRCKY